MLDYLRRKRFINALVADTKLQYREGQETKAPNSRTVVMPEFRPDFTDDQNQRFMAELIQKCYHQLPDNVDDAKQGIIVDTPFGAVFNTVCRHNAQNKRQGMLPGADEYLEVEHQKRTMDLLAEMSFNNVPPMYEAVRAFDAIARTNWQTHSDYGIKELLSPQGKEYLDKLLNTDGLMEEYLKPRNGGQANVELTKKLITEMEDEETAEQMQQQAQPNGADGEGDGESEDGDQAGKEGKGKESKAGEKGEPQSETIYKRLTEKLEGFKVNEVGVDQTVKYPKDFDTSHRAYKIVEKDPGRNTGGDGRAQQVQRCMVDTLSKKVRNVLKVYSQARYQGGKKKGKINKRAIATVVRDNDRIFRQKEVKDVLDTAICLLVDSSGSMSGQKYTYATASTAMMNECLTKLNIPHAVYGFTSDYRECTIYTHKGFYEPVNKDELVSRMLGNNVCLNGNDDGDAVLYAHDHLIKQKQKRKILIVLSDGQPTEGGGDPREYLLSITKEIESKSPVELYGLGILTDSVKDFYKNNRVIHNVNQLEATLLDLIKSSIVS